MMEKGGPACLLAVCQAYGDNDAPAFVLWLRHSYVGAWSLVFWRDEFCADGHLSCWLHYHFKEYSTENNSK